jgi:hypothetical protein
MFYIKGWIKALTLLVTIIVIGCSILKKEDVEKDIRVFLTSFQNSLDKPDAEILKFFNTPQTNEVIMLAVDVLRNKDMANIKCIPSFDKALIYFEDQGIRVVIPTNVQSTDMGIDLKNESTLTLYLKRKDNSFYISKLEGDEFYNSYVSLRNQMDGSFDLEKELLSRKSVYDKAKELQQQYDSVIWYAQYDSTTYFYVVNGEWSNYFIHYWDNAVKPTNYKMGLVDQNGKVIVPVEYDLVGTLGFSLPNTVEVKKDGKVGYFNLEGQQLIPPDFDMIIPYAAEEILIVKKDTTYGWFNSAYQYYPSGFSSPTAAGYIKTFQFLPSQFVLSEKTKTLCEIPYKENLGYGIIIPPSYWTKTGIFREILGGFTIGELRLTANTEFIETNSSNITSITDKINALIMTVKERYLDGREEFYTHDRLVYINSTNDTLATQELSADGKVEFKRIDETLVELKYLDHYSYEPEGYDEYPILMYNYIRLNSDFSVTTLKTNRRFSFTQFVKMDSAYITGEFKTWVNDKEKVIYGLSVNTLFMMRNEILADYGYRFSQQPDIDQFKYFKWYTPEYDSFSQIEDKLTEIDKHNLAFLEKILGPLKENVAL